MDDTWTLTYNLDCWMNCMNLLPRQNTVKLLWIAWLIDICVGVVPELDWLGQGQICLCHPRIGIGQICCALDDVIVADRTLNHDIGAELKRHIGRVHHDLIRRIGHTAQRA